MKLVSWNVNGLRACMKKGFSDFFNKVDADIFCIQETKMHQSQGAPEFEGYEQYWNDAERKGYSGTAIYTRTSPLSVSYGLGIEEHDNEGRVITIELEEFFLICVYTPNSKTDLERLDYRMVWEDEFRNYAQKLEQMKPVIICGDLNVAHKEIDLKNPNTNRRSAGFTDEEREKFTQLLDAGYVDTYRHLYPDVTGAYTWWSYMFNARKNNAGWRIDYFLVSEKLKNRIEDAIIYSDVYGSDHCPVGLILS